MFIRREHLGEVMRSLNKRKNHNLNSTSRDGAKNLERLDMVSRGRGTQGNIRSVPQTTNVDQTTIPRKSLSVGLPRNNQQNTRKSQPTFSQHKSQQTSHQKSQQRIPNTSVPDDSSTDSEYERESEPESESESENEFGSHSEFENEVEEELDPTSNASKKRGRGPAINYDGKEKLHLEFNSYNQPIGPSNKRFKSLLGTIVRCGARAPLDIIRWKKMPQVYLDKIWKEVQEKTDCDESHKDRCLSIASRICSKHKNRVKTNYFLPYMHDRQKLKECPPTVESDQWKFLVKYWKRPDVMAQSEKNIANRKKLLYPSRTGRNTMADIIEERKAKGLDVSRIGLFEAARTRKDGTIPDPTTKEMLEKIRVELDKVPEDQRTPELREKIFTDFMGKDGHGRVRCLGAGPTPKTVFGAVVSSSNSASVVSQRLEALEKKDQEREAEYLKREADHLKREADYKNRTKELEEKQKYLDKLINLMKTHLEAGGVKIPAFDPQTPRSSVGQVQTCSSGQRDDGRFLHDNNEEIGG